MTRRPIRNPRRVACVLDACQSSSAFIQSHGLLGVDTTRFLLQNRDKNSSNMDSIFSRLDPHQLRHSRIGSKQKCVRHCMQNPARPRRCNTAHEGKQSVGCGVLPLVSKLGINRSSISKAGSAWHRPVSERSRCRGRCRNILRLRFSLRSTRSSQIWPANCTICSSGPFETSQTSVQPSQSSVCFVDAGRRCLSNGRVSALGLGRIPSVTCLSRIILLAVKFRHTHPGLPRGPEDRHRQKGHKSRDISGHYYFAAARRPALWRLCHGLIPCPSQSTWSTNGRYRCVPYGAKWKGWSFSPAPTNPSSS